MLNNILNFGGVVTLSKKEQKHVTGGRGSGTCAYYHSESGAVFGELSSSEAQAMLSNADDHWCCDSCGDASWYVEGEYLL